MVAPQSTDPPKRHHYLPQTYQRAWCDSAGHVAVRRRGTSRVFEANPLNVGAESHLYGKGAHALWRERNFGLLEEEWPALRTELMSTGHVNGRERQMVATFIALQVARTREHLLQTTVAAELADFAHERPVTKESARRFIQQHLRHDPEDIEVDAAWSLTNYEISQGIPTVDQAFSISMDIAVRQMAPMFENLHWRIERSEEPVLWTSDRAVMPWRPPSERDTYEGVGYGDADEIRMPLGPTAMLIAERAYSASPKKVPATRFHDYNRDIARQCYEFIICTPGRRARLEHTPLADRRAAIRFHMGPSVEITPDGTEVSGNDVIHTWVPIRDNGASPAS